jgi:hypothetical protein
VRIQRDSAYGAMEEVEEAQPVEERSRYCISEAAWRRTLGMATITPS